MATPVKRIEKDYLLKVLFDEQLPLVYLRSRGEYTFTLGKPVKGELFLVMKRSVPGLKAGRKLNLMFDYRGQVISFSVETAYVREDHIRTTVPEFLYKNLVRSYSRVGIPPDLRIQFAFQEERYSLSYPRIAEYESEEMSNFMRRMDLKNLNGLMEQMAAWIHGCADGHRLVLFNEQKPASLEERLIAATGKTLYLPVVQSGFPQKDPYPRGRIVTLDMFKQFLQNTGLAPDYVDENSDRFINGKTEGGIVSDAWAPILFQEYVIGYIHIWVNKNAEKPPFDYGVIDTLYQFAKILAFSLKANGFFDRGLMKNEPFQGNVIDISASGLLFAYPHSPLSKALLPDTELSVRLLTPGREIKATARIVRHYKDRTLGYFGCQFFDIEPEDLRHLFQFIYGKPFTDADARFLTGQV